MKTFNEDRVYCADTSFLTMFSFPFVYGDPQQALADNSSIVISQSIARKFFGNENPLGKTLLLGGERPFTVTGVFKDVPENSHLKYDILVSFFLQDGWNGGWTMNGIGSGPSFLRMCNWILRQIHQICS